MFFHWKLQAGGGGGESCVLEIQTGGGSCVSGNPGERGGIHQPHWWGGGGGFFLEQPMKGKLTDSEDDFFPSGWTI